MILTTILDPIAAAVVGFIWKPAVGYQGEGFFHSGAVGKVPMPALVHVGLTAVLLERDPPDELPLMGGLQRFVSDEDCQVSAALVAFGFSRGEGCFVAGATASVAPSFPDQSAWLRPAFHGTAHWSRNHAGYNIIGLQRDGVQFSLRSMAYMACASILETHRQSRRTSRSEEDVYNSAGYVCLVRYVQSCKSHDLLSYIYS